MQEVCAKRCCKLTLEDFLILENDEFLSYLEAKFDLSDAHNYTKCLEALSMNPKSFLRADVENYMAFFSEALIENPNIEDPEAGGAHKKAINVIFLPGLQPEHLGLQLAKFCTESVDQSCEAIEKILSSYDSSVAMDMVPAVKSSEKAPQGVFKLKTTTAPFVNTSAAASSPTPAHINCLDCDQPGHAWYRCSSKCLRCPPGTP